MNGGGQAPADEGGNLRRQQSNWVEEVTSPPEGQHHERRAQEITSGESVAPLDVSGLACMFAAIESQVTSLEAAMDSRGRARGGGDDLAGAYGRQVYESLGPMLRQVQESSAAMADRLQVLSEGTDVPPEVVERSSALVSRVERACLAHRARCPPQELERRLSRKLSLPSAPSSALAPGPESMSEGSNAPTLASAAGAASIPADAASGTSFGTSDPRESAREGAPLVRTRTFEEWVVETNNDNDNDTNERRRREQGGEKTAGGVSEEGQGGDDGIGSGGDGGGEGERGTLESMSIDGGDVSKLDGGEQSAIDMTCAAVAAAAAAASANGGVRIYSFGRGDLGALLQADDSDHLPQEGPVALKDHWSVLQVAMSLFHTVAVTASGDVIGCGQNDEGQVRPDLPAKTFMPRPSLLEPVLAHRVTQVSCGLYHTACVTASGVAITWGGNESGQLGHSPEATGLVSPKAIQVAGAGQAWSSRRRASRVACGDLFTLILTSRAELLSCGVGDCVGGDGSDRKQAALVDSLTGFPTVWMACGNSHSVVIGAGGEAMAFGLNTHGQLGVGQMAEGDGPAVLLPRPIVGTSPKALVETPPNKSGVSQTLRQSASLLSGEGGSRRAGRTAPGAGSSSSSSSKDISDRSTAARGRGSGNGIGQPAFFAARAACGQSHTVIVSTNGEVWACGRNRSGQLGLDPVEFAEVSSPVRVQLSPSEGGSVASATAAAAAAASEPRATTASVVQAAAGRAHTMVLLSDGRVVGFGSDEFGALGVAPRGNLAGGGEEADGDVSKPAAVVDDTPPWHWKPTEIEALRGQWVASVSAGGEQSVAIVLTAGIPSAADDAAGSASGDSNNRSAATDRSAVAPGGSAGSTAAVSAADHLPKPSADESASIIGTSATSLSTSRTDTDSLTGTTSNKGTSVYSVASSSSTTRPQSTAVVRQGSEAMFLRRLFSLPPSLRMRTAEEFLELIRRARSGDGATEAAVIEAVRQTFGSPSVLSGCFNVDSPASASRGFSASGLPHVDVEGLEAVFEALMEFGSKVAQELWSSIKEGLEVIISSPSPSFTDREAGISFLLKYWQSPFSALVSAAEKGTTADVRTQVFTVGKAMAKICAGILALDGPARWRLMRSAKEDFPPALFSSRLVRPLVAHLAGVLRINMGNRLVYPAPAVLLKWLYKMNELDPEPKIPYQDFFSDHVSNMHVGLLLEDLQDWKSETPDGRGQRFFLTEYSFLISTGMKKKLLHAEAELEQRKAASAAGLRFVPGIGLVMNPFLVLQINRANLLQETLMQVAQIPDAGLRKKLKVVFRGEEGVDEGGVAKEFFQLLVVQLFDQSFGMFVPAGEEGRALWFNKDCVWADEEYGLVGVLVGLAVYSGVILDVPLPLVVFRKVLGQQLSLRDLGDIDPDLAQGLQKLRDYDGGDDEDVFGIDFRVTWDDLGVQRTHDLKAGGEGIPVTAANKEEYVALYANFLLVDSVFRQFERFKQGFMRVMGGATSVSLFRAKELEVLVTGTSELDFGELARAAEYDGGYGENHPTIKAFWDIVGDMPPEEQRRLLMFVTGSKKAPLGGLGKLDFKIQRAGPDTDHLPTAHTCFNVLMLPEYTGKDKMERLVKRAITECEGFGLK